MARGEGRQRICDAAVRLFNEKGYDAVSLRQIAAEAGTTIGNLTYHFAHKEDLLEAILEDLHAGFAERLDTAITGRELLERLLKLFAENEANQARYPFYFQNLSQLAALFPAIKQRSDEFSLTLHAYYSWAFMELARSGWMDPALDGETARVLAYAIINMQSGWVQASSPYRNELLPQVPLSQAVCTMMRPYICEDKRAAFDALCVSAAARAV